MPTNQNSIIKNVRIFLGRIASAFFISQPKRRYIRKLFENYNLSDAKKYKSFKYKIISLGENCMGRTIPTKFGLKPTKIYGEKTLITDQIFFHSINDLIKLWNNNFEDLLEGVYYSDKKSAWVLPKYSSFAPHEFKLSINDFRLTINKRIKNFYEVCQTDKYAIFVRFQSEATNITEIKALADKIKSTRGNKPFRLLFINHNTPITGFVDNNIIIVNYPMTLSYKWTNELFTDEGKKFCAAVIEPLKEIIAKID